ncbi:uncharacterized protein EV154DRAFT_521256 [Mucor mucedo]|uniref:uncharacterized protein n=1 Tax=Mucor mucedo TaxID=29922 RepID=UPI00221FA4BC|nr:uncharacterized protein EV154DRAFT_521256 [Mucor mucedo]KAI7886377.1 hypothetical protein EV154DRAFT_521256 [Mucor mucedo]
MQNKLSQLGYFTVDAAIDLPEKKEGESLLDTCYKELTKATTDLSFFPPLLISHGDKAARISQKFVSNKPVSGLVMMDSDTVSDLTEFPLSEFEPRFPICMISKGPPPEFLDGWIDHLPLKKGQELKDLEQWMDQVGM